MIPKHGMDTAHVRDVIPTMYGDPEITAAMDRLKNGGMFKIKPAGNGHGTICRGS